MKKKTFYAVATTIFDDGRTIVRLAGTQLDYVRPANKFNSTPRVDHYIDWFDSEDDAKLFIQANTI